MGHNELLGSNLVWPLVGLVAAEHGVEVLKQISVVARGLHHELLVEQLKHRGTRLVLNQVDGLLVVREPDVLPGNTLLYVFFLLHLEHLLVKHLLQLFIRVVNAKLLK